ncbi:hypothetical protein A8F94_01485 [Bacillus sp. FJAT-27225]|uniref:hypothetical protein n=1 Tax=Bacillus sp. FJAT-27225 TaxID=1743144 RepID=UPI00080C2B8D|nr:hypothetical protein [Bacillus sp. FJAT-27225]OCA90582.1 hypothetical protein A8F94_01485 [Bacillus sp. FJAT-27225]
MEFADVYLVFWIFFVPTYLGLIFTYRYPEESMLLGKRWMYKEEPEISEGAIRYTKTAALIGLIAFPVFLLVIFTR